MRSTRRWRGACWTSTSRRFSSWSPAVVDYPTSPIVTRNGSMEAISELYEGYAPCAGSNASAPPNESLPAMRSCRTFVAAITNSPPKSRHTCASRRRSPNSRSPSERGSYLAGGCPLQPNATTPAGFHPLTAAAAAAAAAADHKAYYPGARPDRAGPATARPADCSASRWSATPAARSETPRRRRGAIHAGPWVEDISHLDLSYAPPLASPWDAVQIGAQTWEQAALAVTSTR